jgi:hypothetical protein
LDRIQRGRRRVTASTSPASSAANATGDPAAAGGGSPTPSLSGALAYSLEEFTNLLRTGTPREPGKQLGLMGETARRSLTWLTNEEIAATYEYLKALPPSGVIESR